MKLTETIKIPAPPRNQPFEPKSKEGYDIATPAIDTLIETLAEKGITINSQYSSAEVRYEVAVSPDSNVQETAVVQLGNPILETGEVTAYHLRDGEGLELVLKNYSKTEGEPDPDFIGGSVSGEYGVIGKLSVESGNGINSEIVGAVREAMKLTYDVKFNEVTAQVGSLEVDKKKAATSDSNPGENRWWW